MQRIRIVSLRAFLKIVAIVGTKDDWMVGEAGRLRDGKDHWSKDTTKVYQHGATALSPPHCWRPTRPQCNMHDAAHQVKVAFA